MFQKLKQYKDLRDSAKKLQTQLSAETFHVETWGGNVSMIMDGNQAVMALDIKADVLKPENKQKLEESIKEAVGEGVKKVQRSVAQKIQKGEIQVPDFPGKK
ncbi:MAG: YbaB/EbfC family nucleoid-associated protein [Patescibacteria group bacterium]